MASIPPFATIAQLAALIKEGAVTPLALTQHYLGRIEQLDPRLNAYINVTAERALAQGVAATAALEQGDYHGPLHGVPLALKDLIDITGLPTTGGSLLRKDHIANRDATIYRRLCEAGAVVLGKTHLVEFAFGGAGINHHYGTPHNPWDTDTPRLPGGSSSGSAVAVAADLAPAALGSDTGGSVRIPASFNGLVGLKPTFGRVSNYGVLPLDPTLDSLGPLTRSVADAALLYQIIAGVDPADPTTLNRPHPNCPSSPEGAIAGWQLRLPRQLFWDDVDPQVEAAVRQAAEILASLGAQVDDLDLPELDELAALRQKGSTTAVESYRYHREDLVNNLDQFDPIVSQRMLDGRDLSAADFLDISRALVALRHKTTAALSQVDFLLTPTTPFAALPVAEVDQADHYFRLNGLCLRNTSVINQLGLCAISLPCGFTESGLPIGLQLVGHPFDEARLLHLAQAYEAATSWNACRPQLDGFSQ